MAKKKPNQRPDWNSIRNYVGGRINDERQQIDQKIERLIASEATNRITTTRELAARVDRLAIWLAHALGFTDEPAQEDESTEHKS